MNKFTKLLSVFVIAGAIGTGVAGAVGCNNNNPDPKPEGPGDTTHNHQTWSTTGTDNGNGTHKLTCTTDGCTETKDEAHKDVDEDDVCDVCEAELDAAEDANAVTSVKINDAKDPLDAGDEIQLSVTVAPATASQEVTWSITDGDDLATIDATGKLKIKETATTGGEVTVKAVSKVTTTKSHTKTFTINKVTKFHELKADTANNIIAEDFSTTTTIPDFSGTYGTKGVYANKKGAKATLTVVGGAAVQNAGTAEGEVQTIVDFGTVKDVVEGYVEMTLTGGDSWTMLRIQGTDGRKESDGTTDKVDETIGLRAAGGKLNYRIGGGGNKGGTGAEFSDNGVAPTAGAVAYTGTIPVYFKYNKITQTLDLTVSGVEYLKGYKTKITSVKGLCFASSSDGKKIVTVDNIAINTYDLSDAEIATGLKATADALNTAAVALKGTAWTSGATETSLSSAKTTVDAALDATGVTATDARSAYATYESAVYDALATEYLAKLQDAYKATNYTNAGPETGVEVGVNENVQAYANAVTAATTAFGNVDSLAGFATVLEAQKLIFAEIPDNARLNKAKVVITISNGEDTIGTLNAKDGDSVTKADLDEVCTPGAGKTITGYKTGSLSGTDVAFPYAATAVDADEDGTKDDTQVTLYAVVVDTSSVKQVFNASTLTGDAAAEGAKLPATENELFTVANTGNSHVLTTLAADSEVTPALVGTATANDESGLEFTKAWVPGGKDKAVTVTATKAIKLTVYYTSSDSNFNSKSQSKGGNLTWIITPAGGTAAAKQTDTNTANKDGRTAYAVTIELAAGAKCELCTDSNRFVLFALVALPA